MHQLFMTAWKSAAAASIIFAVAGCGVGGPLRYGVSGKVAVDGKNFSDLDKNVVSASISFEPEEGTRGGSSGSAIDLATGEYVVEPEHGLLEGRYKVKIVAFWKTGRILKPDLAGPAADAIAQGTDPSLLASEEQRQFIPRDFNSATTLTIAIEDDMEGVDFDVKSGS